MKKILLTLMVFGSFGAFAQADPSYDEALHNEYTKYIQHLSGEEPLDAKTFKALEKGILAKNSFLANSSIAETYLFAHLNRPIDANKGLDILKTSFENGQLNKANATSNYFRVGGSSTYQRVSEFNKIFQTNLRKSFANFLLLRDIVLANALGLADEDLIDASREYYLPISPASIDIDEDNIVTNVYKESIFLDQIQVGDKIFKINGEIVNDYYDFRKARYGLREGQRSTISIIRNGAERTIRFKAAKSFQSFYDLLPLAWIEFKKSNYLNSNQLVEEYFNHPERLKLGPILDKNMPPFDAFANGIKCLALGYPATRDPKTLSREIIDLCESSINDFEKSLESYGILDAENNPFVKVRLSEFNPNYADAYDQVLGFLAKYYLGPWQIAGASNDLINLELAELNTKKSILLSSSQDEQMSLILLGLAKIDIDLPIPKSTYEKVNKDLMNQIEWLANLDTGIGDWMKQHAANVYRYNDEFSDTNAELKMLLALIETKHRAINHYERLGQLYYEKQEYETAVKYMDIALNEFNSKYAAWKIGEWHTEVKEIFDLKKAYFAYKKGEELGSEFSANRRLAILMDYEVEIPQDEVDEFIQKNAFKLNDKNYFKSADFYDYLVQGYLSGSASFAQNDDLLCKYAADGVFLDSVNYLSKLWNGWCVLIDDRPGSKTLAENYLQNVSSAGSSTASLYLSVYYQELGGLDNLNRALDFYRKSLNQNKDKDYKDLNKRYSWINAEDLYFNADIKYIRGIGDEIKDDIKREKAYLAAIKKEKKEKEKQRLALQREKQRAKSRERTAEVTSGFFNFLGDVLVVAGTIALAAAAVDVIADADPEVLNAMTESFNSNSYSYTYDWDGFFDAYGNWTYRCRTIETGRFAEDYKCSGEYKDDDRWPSNY